jgi:hypothetical protein
MVVETQTDVCGLGPPIRSHFPNQHRNYVSGYRVKDREHVKPYYVCSVSDSIVIMHDYARKMNSEQREAAFQRLKAVTESYIGVNCDESRVFYGDCLFRADRSKVSFEGEYNNERETVLRQLLIRAFAHDSICNCFIEMRQIDPEVYFSKQFLGTLESIVGQRVMNTPSQRVLFR